MSVRNGFTIEIHEFTPSLRTSLARDAHDAIAVGVNTISFLLVLEHLFTCE